MNSHDLWVMSHKGCCQNLTRYDIIHTENCCLFEPRSFWLLMRTPSVHFINRQLNASSGCLIKRPRRVSFNEHIKIMARHNRNWHHHFCSKYMYFSTKGFKIWIPRALCFYWDFCVFLLEDFSSLKEILNIFVLIHYYQFTNISLQ